MLSDMHCRLLGLLASALLLFLAGQPVLASAAENNTVTLTYWEVNGGSPRTQIVETLLGRFEKSHPNIKVTYVGLPEADYEDKVEAAIAAGNPPDVSDPQLGEMAAFAAEGGLIPIGSRFNSWSGKKQISTAGVSLVKGAGGGTLYGIPLTLNTGNVIYYRADWVQQDGLQAPSTWPAFFKDASALTNSANGVYGFGLRGAEGSVSQLEAFVFSEAGLTSYFTKNGKSVMNEPAAVAAAKKYVALYGKDTSKGDLSSGGNGAEMVSEYTSGHAAMIIHNLGTSTTGMPDGSVGIEVMPKSTVDGKQILSFSGNPYVMFKGTAHEQAAWQLMTYLSSPSADLYWNTAYGGGQIPANNVAAKEDKNPSIALVEKALAQKDTVSVAAPNYLPDYSTIEDQLVAPFQKVLVGQMSVQAFMNEWASMMTKAEAQWLKAHKPKKGAKG